MIIEKNIPIPDYYPKSTCVYPFDKLEVGDSFLVTENPVSARVALRYWQKKTGKKFLARKQKDNSGLRIWRLS